MKDSLDRCEKEKHNENMTAIKSWLDYDKCRQNCDFLKVCKVLGEKGVHQERVMFDGSYARRFKTWNRANLVIGMHPDEPTVDIVRLQ